MGGADSGLGVAFPASSISDDCSNDSDQSPVAGRAVDAAGSKRTFKMLFLAAGVGT